MRVMKNFAEVPGAIVLLLVSWFQIGLASVAEKNVLIGHIFALENQMYDVCSRLSNLELVAGQNTRYCDRFPYDPKSQGSGHLTWPQAQELFGYLEQSAFLIGVSLFVAGIIYRLYRND